MKRKHPPIDLLKLWSGRDPQFVDESQFVDEDFAVHNTLTKRLSSSHAKWNVWLKHCLNNELLDEIIRVRYGIQVGMDDAAKAKLNSPALCEMYCRWMGSLDRTARKIIQKRRPIPKIEKSLELSMATRIEKIKRQRDRDFELFLRKASF